MGDDVARLFVRTLVAAFLLWWLERLAHMEDRWQRLTT